MTIKLDHVNISVQNLQESIEWYQSLFGFRLVESGISPANIKWGIIAQSDSMICMTEHAGRRNADGPRDESIYQIYHFGLRISDVEQWETTVKTKNLKLHYGGVNEYPSSKSWYVRDPSGHEIEVSYSYNQPLRFPTN